MKKTLKVISLILAIIMFLQMFDVKAVEVFASVEKTESLSAPTNLVVEDISESSITLSWDSITDNAGLERYEIYDGSGLIGSSYTNKFTTIVDRTKVYVFYVKAIDIDGNFSAESNKVMVKLEEEKEVNKNELMRTIEDDTNNTESLEATNLTEGDENLEEDTEEDENIPKLTNVFVTEVTGYKLTLSWGVESDSTEINLFEIYLGDKKIGETTEKNFRIGNLTPNTTYKFKVRGKDSLGNYSEWIESANVTTKDDDYGDDIDSSTLISIENKVNVNINYIDDEDYLYFIAPTTGEYIIKTTDGISTTGILYDELKNQVDNNSKYGGFNITYKLEEGKKYYLCIKGYRSSTGSCKLSIEEKDVEAPTKPSNVQEEDTTVSSITIVWEASSDNVEVDKYNIYRDGVKIGSVKKDVLRYKDTSLKGGTTYEYEVEAVDTSTNYSLKSDKISITTLVDNIKPTTPRDINAIKVTGYTIELKWAASIDNGEVELYEIYADDTKLAESKTNSCTIEKLNPNTTYTFKIRAKDLSGNYSEFSTWSQDITTCEDDYGDRIEDAKYISAGRLIKGTTNYEKDEDYFYFYPSQSGTYIIETIGDVETEGTLYSSSGNWLASGYSSKTNKNFTIKKSLTRGNKYYICVSGKGIGKYGLSISTEDTKSPTTPNTLKSKNITNDSVTITWWQSTDNIGVNEYYIYRDGEKIAAVDGSQNQYTDTSLIEGTTYEYKVVAADLAGNVSGYSDPIQVCIKEDAPKAATNLKVTETRSNSITLSWESSEDAIRYEIERNGVIIGVTSELSFTDKALYSGTNYNYRVRSKKESTTSEWSSIVSASTEVTDIEQRYDVTLSADRICNNLTLTSGKIDLNGHTLTVSGDVYQSGGEIEVNHGKLIVQGNYTINGASKLTVVNNDDTVNISGNITSDTNITKLENGTMSTTLLIPTNITTTTEENTIIIKWDEVVGAKSYAVEVNGEIKKVNTNCIILNLPSGTENKFRVRAELFEEVGDWSELETVITAIEAPNNLEFQEVTATKVTLSWDENESNTEIQGYVIYRNEERIALVNADTLTYTDTGLNLGNEYTYTIKTISITDVLSENESKNTITTALEKPSVMASEANSLVTLKWNDVEEATSYDVEINGEVKNVTSNSYTVENLVSGNEIKVRVRAKNESYCSEWSELKSTTTVLDPPKNLIQSNIDKNKVTLSWEENNENNSVEGYVIYRNGEEIASVSATTLKYTDTGLNSNTTYTYEIKSKNIEGTISNNAAIINIITLLESPTSITATTEKSSIVLKWDEVVGATGYEVEVNGEIKSIDTNCISIQLPSGTENKFRVRAKGNNNISEWSDLVLAKTLIENPKNLIFKEVTATKVTLSWESNEDNVGIQGYVIYRNGEKVDQVNADILNYTDIGLNLDNEYTYTVKSISADGVLSENGITNTIKTTLEYPKLIATANNEVVKLSWDKIEGATSYDVEINGTVKNISSNEYTVENLLSGSEVKYRVRAVNGNTVSRWSDLETVYTTIEAPNTIEATDTEKGIKLSWNANEKNGKVLGYIIYRNGKKLDYVPEGIFSYFDNDVENGVEYIYSIRTESNCGYLSDNSVEVNIIKNKIVEDTSESEDTSEEETVTDMNINSDVTLNKDIVCNNLILTSGKIDLNGHVLTVLGNITQSGGVIKINNGSLKVSGEYRISGTSKLIMNKEKDYVLINGDFITKSDCSEEGFLTAGILEIKGNISNLSGNISNFYQDGTLKLILSGNNTTIVNGNSKFNILDISKSNGVVFKSSLNAKELIGIEKVLNDDSFTIYDGNIVLNTDVNIKGNLKIQNGTIDLNGYSLEITGSIEQIGGKIIINGGQLVVDESYVLSNSSLLVMTNDKDYVLVKGNFKSISKTSEDDYLINGIIEIKGNIEVSNFYQSGNSILVLSGSDVVNINANNTKFNIIDISKSVGVIFTSKVSCNNFIGFSKIKGSNVFTLLNSNIELTQGENISCSLNLENTTVNLNGYSFVIGGNLNQYDGIIDISYGKLIVYGNYKLEGNSLLKMMNKDDYVVVYKDFETRSFESERGYLLYGTIEFKGNMTQIANNIDNFRCYINLVFTGEKVVSIKAASYETFLGYIDITNSNGVIFEAPINCFTIKGFSKIRNPKELQIYYIRYMYLDTDFVANFSITFLDSGFEDQDNGLFSLEGFSLTINGDLNQKSGNISLYGKSCGGNLTVCGNYTLENNGKLIPHSSNDYILIEGDFIINNISLDKSDNYKYIEGTIEVKGNIIQHGDYELNFTSTYSSVLVKLSGDAPVRVDLEAFSTIYFATIDLSEANGVVFAHKVNARKIIGKYTVEDNNDFEMGNSRYKLFEDTVYEGDFTINEGTLDLNGYELIIYGNLYFNGGIIKINGGSLIVDKNFIQTDGKVDIQNGELIVGGNYEITGTSLLVMENKHDYVYVEGDFEIRTMSSEKGYLTNGIIELCGDFKQGGNKYSFATSGNHEVYFTGDGLQLIYFADSKTSYFNKVDVTGSNGVLCTYNRQVSILDMMDYIPCPDAIKSIISAIDNVIESSNSTSNAKSSIITSAVEMLENLINSFLNDFGMQYMSLEDLGYFAAGVVVSADDGFCFSIVQNAYARYDKYPPEDNVAYMRGKVLGDILFEAIQLKNLKNLMEDLEKVTIEVIKKASTKVALATGTGFFSIPVAGAATIKDAIAEVISISLVVYAGAEVLYIAYKTNDDLYKLDEASKGGSNNTSRPSSRVLRKNMKEAGIEEPDYPNAAHHIIAGGDKRAKKLRDMLKEYGIDINSADNGVFLPTEKNVSEAAYHRKLHTDKYYKNVEKAFQNVNSKEDIIYILHEIREQLLNGTFPF